MTSAPNEPDRQIAEDVLPTPVDEPARLMPLTELAPWHRVRKQLVREQQWLLYSERLIKREKGRPALPEQQDGTPEVHYLTLPGMDYLDVRQLAELCHRLGCSLTSTGFQYGDDKNPVVARAELRRKSLIDAGYITRHSHTFPKRLEDISSRNSAAYRALQDRGPFHIVNIDACGSIAAPSATHSHRLVEALHRVIEFQLGFMKGRWLLFVTTNAHPDSIAKDALAQFHDAVFSNADKNADFNQQAMNLLDPAAADIRAAAASVSGVPSIEFLRLFSLGLAKWCLSFARHKQWEMHTHHPYCYTTMPREDSTPSMACLAFEFRPPPTELPDLHNISRTPPTGVVQREDLSVRAAKKIADMTNADSCVETDQDLFKNLAENLRRLLEEAGYPSALLSKLEA